MDDKGDNPPDHDQVRGSQMTTGRSADSAFSQGVDLLERSVTLLKESPLERYVSSSLEERPVCSCELQVSFVSLGGPNLFISIVVAFFNRAFHITPISLKFGILNEKCWNFQKMLLFSN